MNKTISVSALKIKIPPSNIEISDLIHRRIVFIKDKLYGVMDKHLNIVINPIFDQITDYFIYKELYHKPIALAKYQGGCGVISRRGKIVIPFEYTHIYWGDDGDLFFV
jgi:hypothetical protein